MSDYYKKSIKPLISTVKLTQLLGGILILIGLIWLFYIRFTNIDMTGTRMFLSYWKQWLAIFTFFIGGSWLIFKSA